MSTTSIVLLVIVYIVGYFAALTIFYSVNPEYATRGPSYRRRDWHTDERIGWGFCFLLWPAMVALAILVAIVVSLPWLLSSGSHALGRKIARRMEVDR